MNEPTVIAHRGFAGVFPENTTAAFRGAVDRGADMVELDVQPTAEGDVVVFHDRRLDDRTDASGVVWEQSTAAVTASRILDTDVRVPTLAAALESIPDDVRVNVELKNPGTTAVQPGESLDGAARERARERWVPFVESVVAVTDRFEHDILFSSFCEGALPALETVDPAADSAALVAPNCADAGTTVARRYGVDAIHPPIEQCDPDAAVDWEAVAAELNASLNVWTVRDWLDARTAVRAGADGLIADYPGLWRGR